jgi:hypothetical protein
MPGWSMSRPVVHVQQCCPRCLCMCLQPAVHSQQCCSHCSCMCLFESCKLRRVDIACCTALRPNWCALQCVLCVAPPLGVRRRICSIYPLVVACPSFRSRLHVSGHVISVFAQSVLAVLPIRRFLRTSTAQVESLLSGIVLASGLQVRACPFVAMSSDAGSMGSLGSASGGVQFGHPNFKGGNFQSVLLIRVQGMGPNSCVGVGAFRSP